MSDVSLNSRPSARVTDALPVWVPAPSPAVARRFTLLALLWALVLPDCCLNGSHAFGSGMETMGAICRARI